MHCILKRKKSCMLKRKKEKNSRNSGKLGSNRLHYFVMYSTVLIDHTINVQYRSSVLVAHRFSSVRSFKFSLMMLIKHFVSYMSRLYWLLWSSFLHNGVSSPLKLTVAKLASRTLGNSWQQSGYVTMVKEKNPLWCLLEVKVTQNLGFAIKALLINLNLNPEHWIFLFTTLLHFLPFWYPSLVCFLNSAMFTSLTYIYFPRPSQHYNKESRAIQPRQSKYQTAW